MKKLSKLFFTVLGALTFMGMVSCSNPSSSGKAYDYKIDITCEHMYGSTQGNPATQTVYVKIPEVAKAAATWPCLYEKLTGPVKNKAGETVTVKCECSNYDTLYELSWEPEANKKLLFKIGFNEKQYTCKFDNTQYEDVVLKVNGKQYTQLLK